jgi:hypothetical protein
MPQDVANPSTPVTQADLANASALNGATSAVRQALSTSSASIVALLTTIGNYITQKLVGGVVGTSTNRLLKSKTVSSGSSAGSLQASGVTCDGSNNLSGIGNIDLTGNVVTSGGSFYVSADGTGFGPTGALLGAGKIYNLYGYNSTSLAYVSMLSVTTNNPPTLNLISTATKGGVGIATLATNVWTQQQGFTRVSLTDAATIAWNAQTQQSAYVLLTSGVGGTRALGTPSNLVSGFTYVLVVQQSSTGSNALTYSGVYKWPGGVAPVLSTANNAIDILTFASDGTNMYGVAQLGFA